MKILFLGDVVGRPGRAVVARRVPMLRQELKLDFVIANGENLASGVGITMEKAEEMFRAGVDALTSGNHVWKKKEFVDYLARTDEPRILRPANYPDAAPGCGYRVYQVGAVKLGVVNLQGRIFMDPIDCPFQAGRRAVHELKSKGATVIFVDMHAEATSEKRAMGHFLDGHVSVVVGTHTHIQTADEEILPGGTAYLTDAGMVGVAQSVIGVEIAPILERFLTQVPVKFEVPKSGEVILCGAVIEVDPAGRATSIRRIQERHPYGGDVRS
ncbi:MAG: metallophosphoesterase [Candidatus Lindowbacteria bacterium RIFCSPLOWO2_12_FULL_62_27]|nr:MAG: metallophosphoesterase [Candidatus Lindowbacteria bacterium RIFCSPLOWO2_12_FULL_62_27]OGH62334.1 MAG: metallophosphoesterase [Candidatus Lindowbacteria bacterium RIFCSPLOWO2_02_FULL_62_12]